MSLKIIALSMVFSLSSTLLFGQFVERSLLSAGGGLMAGGAGYVVFTIGEAAIGTFDGMDMDLTQGQQQGNTLNSTDVQYALPILPFSFFPNPTFGLIHLDREYQLDNSELVIYDVMGKMHLQIEATDLSNQIQLEHMPAGIYWIQVLKKSVPQFVPGKLIIISPAKD